MRLLMLSVFLIGITCIRFAIGSENLSYPREEDIAHLKSIISAEHYPEEIERDMQDLFIALLNATNAERDIIEEVRVCLKPLRESEGNLADFFTRTLPSQHLTPAAIDAMLKDFFLYKEEVVEEHAHFALFRSFMEKIGSIISYSAEGDLRNIFQDINYFFLKNFTEILQKLESLRKKYQKYVPTKFDEGSKEELEDFFKKIKEEKGLRRLVEELEGFFKKIKEEEGLKFVNFREKLKDYIARGIYLKNLYDGIIPLSDYFLEGSTNRRELLQKDSLERNAFPPFDIVDSLKTVSDLYPLHTSIIDLLKSYYERQFQKICNLKKGERALYIESRVVMRTIYGPYNISQEVSRHILARNDEGKKQVTGQEAGTSRVTSQGGIHFKEQGSGSGELEPGMEWGMYAFTKLLVGEGVTPSAFIVLDNIRYISSLPECMGLQISRTVQGRSLNKELIDENPTLTFDLDSYSAHVFTNLVTIPTDHKDDNFMVTTGPNKIRKLINIDGDRALGSMIIKKMRESRHYVQGKNILYLLDQMMKEQVSQSIAKRIKEQSMRELLLFWLKLLDQHNRSYSHFVDEVPKGYFVSKAKEIGAELFTVKNLQVYFRKGVVESIYQKLLKLSNLISGEQASKLPTHEKLISIMYPEAASFYRTLREEFQNNPHKAQHGTLYGQGGDGRSIEQLNIIPPDNCPDGEEYQRDRCLNPWDTFEEFNRTGQDWLRTLTYLRKINWVKSLRDELNRLKAKNISFANYDEDRTSCLQVVIQEGSSRKIANWVLAQAEDEKTALNHVNLEGYSVLDYSLKMHSTRFFNFLIEKGARKVNRLEASIKFYKRFIKENIDSSRFPLPDISDKKRRSVVSFKVLMDESPNIEWEIAKEEMFLSTDDNSGGIWVEGSSSGRRYLPRFVKEQILSDDNKFKKYDRNALDTTHIVARAEFKGHQLYFKVLPDLPGIEEAVGRLTRRLIGFGAPYTELYKILNFPVLVSQGIQGHTLKEVFGGDFTQEILDPNFFDLEGYTALTLMAILINPEDGKPANYVADFGRDGLMRRIIGIDNDHSFIPPEEKDLVVKTVLFCFDQMQTPIPMETKNKFINISILPELKGWLKEMVIISRQYMELFPEWKHQHCKIDIKFRADTVSTIYGKLLDIQKVLTKRGVRCLDVLKELNPLVAKRYQTQLEDDSSKHPSRRFKILDHQYYNTKREFFITTTESNRIVNYTPPSTENNPPIGVQEALEQINNLMMVTNCWDLEGNSVLSYISSTLRNYKLEICESLNFERCGGLTKNFFKGIEFKLLKKIDLRELSFNKNFSKMFNGILLLLSKSAPNLKELNAANNPNLEYLSRYSSGRGTFRRHFNASNPFLVFLKLKRLSVADCSRLFHLDISAPQLRFLDLSNCSLLDDEVVHSIVGNFSKLERLKTQGSGALTSYLTNFNKEIQERVKSSFEENDEIVLDLENTNFSDEDAFHLTRFGAAQRVPRLVLSHNQLSDEGVKLLGTIPNLQNLDVRGNPISEEGRFYCLRHINAQVSVDDVQIGDINIHDLADIAKKDSEIPDDVCLLIARYSDPKMQVIGSKLGDIGDICAEIISHNLMIKDLSLQNAGITDTGALFLMNMSDLEQLDLEKNSLSVYMKLQLLIKMGNKVKVDHETIDGIDICDIAQWNREDRALSIDNCIRVLQASSLESFNGGGAHIGDVGARILSRSRVLRNIYLQRANITDAGVEFLRQMTQLERLDLRDNPISPETKLNLLDAMGERVRVSEDRQDDIDLHVLNRLLKGEKAFDLENQFIGDVGAYILAKSETLERLNLVNVGLTDAGAGLLMRMVQIDFLDLTGNDLSKGMRFSLKKKMGEKVRLDNTTIGAFDINELASMARSDPRLEDETCMSLANIDNTSEKTFRGLGRYIGNVGVTILSRNINLESLYLQNSGITSIEANDFIRMPHLKLLDLTGNTLDENTKLRLFQHIRSAVATYKINGTKIGVLEINELARIARKDEQLSDATCLEVARSTARETADVQGYIGDAGAEIFSNSYSLKNITLYNSGMSVTGAKTIMAMLNLRVFSAQYYYMRRGGSLSWETKQALSNHEGYLKLLTLKNMKLLDGDVRFLLDLNCTIENLDLSGNNISYKVAWTIITDSDISLINLSNNPLSHGEKLDLLQEGSGRIVFERNEEVDEIYKVISQLSQEVPYLSNSTLWEAYLDFNKQTLLYENHSSIDINLSRRGPNVLLHYFKSNLIDPTTKSTLAPKIRGLNISHTYSLLSGEVAELFSILHNLGKLDSDGLGTLNLSYCRISKNYELLANISPWITSLVLAGNSLLDGDLRPLWRLGSLIKLDLSNNLITDRGVDQLIWYLRNIEELNLSGNKSVKNELQGLNSVVNGTIKECPDPL